MRTFLWCVRRELWENRSIVVAPLIVSVFALTGVFINVIRRLPQKMRMPGGAQEFALATPYSMLAAVILMSGFVVGMFYCVDALQGERRDRSLLFWKSLPVSDLVTVLSKAAIPFFVVPLVTFTITLIGQALLLFAGSGVLMANGISPARLWSLWPRVAIVMLYGLVVHAFWYAPIHGWLLLVSAWAKRAALLWAVLPILALVAFERMATGASSLGAMIRYRFQGALTEAFADDGSAPMSLSKLDPLKLLQAPGFWFGLLFAAACLAIAARLRRSRESV